MMSKESLIKKYGDFPLAYLTAEKDLSSFETDSGFIAYKHKSVLGDPICAQKDSQLLLETFTKKHPQHCFYHIQEQTADYLSKLGYAISFMGHEHTINLASFSPTWKAQSSLKSGNNKCIHHDVRIIEQDLSELSTTHLRDIETAWLNSKQHSHPVRFMIRPMDFTTRDNFRYFFAYQNKSLIGYYFFAPIYKNTEIIGYYTDNCRYVPQFGKNLSDAFLLHAINCFRKESHQKLSLGLCPFAETYTSTFKQHILIPTLFKAIYHLNFPPYGYKGLYGYTKKFHAKKTPYFFASNSRFPVTNLFSTWKYMFLDTTA